MVHKIRKPNIARMGTGWACTLSACLLLALMTCMQPAIARNPADRAPDSGGILNFVDADIESVIAAVGDYTNTTFIIDPRVKGTLSLVSEKPLSKAEAFRLLSTALRMRGYAVVTGSGYSKVVPEADAKLLAGPVQSGGLRGDQVATQVFHLDYESAANLVNVLRPLISPNNTINANPGNNTLVITDYADNLLRLGKIISALDNPGTDGYELVQVRYAVASDIAVMASRLLESGPAPAGDTTRISLMAYPRTNSIVIRAPSAAKANLAKALIAQLDQPTAVPGNVHVVYLKNAEATKLAQTLRAIVASDSSINTASSPAPAQTTPPGTAPVQQQAALSTGGPAGFIQADPTTNTLIISASESVYRDLRTVIDKLDARRAQVYIESLIVEVSATKASELGVQWAGLSGDANSSYRVGALTGFSTGGNNLINQAAAAATNSAVAPGNGLSIGVFRQSNGQLGLGALAHALASDSNTNILSMPNLITLDNEEAKIIVGQNVPFITGSYTTTASATGSAGVNPFQTVERKDIGLTLKVKPQISEGGTVKMAIYQETSGIDTTVNTGGAGLATTKRSLDTNVLVDDGQIIVLGGLIDDNMQDTVEKVPGLGDIPLIGALFRYKTHTHVKRNLMVFLRPTVIRDNDQSMDLSADRYDFIRNEQINSPPDNMPPPQLPALQNGQISGGTLFNRMDAGKFSEDGKPATPPPTPTGPDNVPAPQDPVPPTPKAPE